MARLIVHADDFGLSEKVNAGILKAYKRGILTSTSIIAAGSACEHAIDIARVEEGLDIGVHLTLVGERPLLDSRSVKSLVAGDERFPADVFRFLGRYWRGNIDLEEVYRELDAQIGKIRDAGLVVSHLDSHQHLHMLPGILAVTLRLAQKHGISFIRIPRERTRFSMWRRPALYARLVQMWVLGSFCLRGRTKISSHTPDFYGFFNGGRLAKTDMVSIIEHLACDATAELMCHPGLDDPDSVYRRWNYKWQQELEVLLDPDLPSLLRKWNVDLASYRDLTGNG